MAAPQNLVHVTSPAHFQESLAADLQRVSLINFWAPWAEPCKQMNEVVFELAKKYPNMLALQVEAEEQQDITEDFEINSVPTFIILRGHTLLSRIEGADAQKLTSDIATHLTAPPSSSSATSGAAITASGAPRERTKEELAAYMQALMKKDPVVLFMKGSPDAPQCGFSRTAVGILRKEGIEFGSFDILKDENVRQGLKTINNWPTFPQFIVNGEFVGGLDVIKEMLEAKDEDGSDESEFMKVFKQGIIA